MSLKTKSMVVSGSRTIASGYGELTLGGSKLGEVKSLRVLEVTLGSRLTFEIHLRGKLFDSLHGLNSCFKAYVLSSLEYCSPG